MQGAFSPAASLSQKERTLSLSLSLLYIHTCGLSSFLKNVFILFLDLQKRVRVDQTPLPLFSLSLSLRLFTSLVESCLRDNNRDD
jgi:hypothetical protein